MLAMRLLARIAARYSAPSSGNPYAHAGSVRCAVLASITTVRSFVTNAADSRAASSGRHKNATSAAFNNSARATVSLRRSGAIVSNATSSRRASRS